MVVDKSLDLPLLRALGVSDAPALELVEAHLEVLMRWTEAEHTAVEKYGKELVSVCEEIYSFLDGPPSSFASRLRGSYARTTTLFPPISSSRV